MFPTMPFIHDDESFQESMITMQQSVDDDDADADETLSLCDLEIYNDATTSQENDISSSSSSSSSLSLEEDLFEFFSEECSDSLNTFHPSNTPPENIIFCGKIIAYKQPSSPKKPKKSNGLFRWNSDKGPSKSNTITSTPPRTKSLPIPEKYNNDFIPKQTSIFQSPMKSRWYLFFFGMGGFPKKMELSDIRSRQIRRSSPTMFRVESGGDKKEVVMGGAAASQTKVVAKAATVGCFGGF